MLYLPRYFLFKKNTITQRLYYVSKTWITDIIIFEIFTGMKAWYSKIPLFYHWTFKTYNLEKQDIGKSLVLIFLHLSKLHFALFFCLKILIRISFFFSRFKNKIVLDLLSFNHTLQKKIWVPQQQKKNSTYRLIPGK